MAPAGAVAATVGHHHGGQGGAGSMEQEASSATPLLKKWQQIVMEGGKLEDGGKLKGIRKMSTKMYLKSQGIRLHCRNLVERLLFEATLARGLFRLMNQLAIFALLLLAMQYTGDPSVQRGIFNNLRNSFDFHALGDIKSREALVDILPILSQTSKKYFALSSKYFGTGMHGNVQLIRALRSFSRPEPLIGLDITMHVPAFSFSTWIKITRQFANGYLIRKPLKPSSVLSCWGWYLDARTGPQLHFGGHDFYPTDEQMILSKQRQTTVMLDAPDIFPAEVYTLITVIVNKSHAVFYRDVEVLGVQEMLRPISDCFNNQAGFLLGDADMELGQFRFYPKALSAANIIEIYGFGSTLADISTGSQPIDVDQPELVEFRRSLENDIAQVHAAVKSRQEQIDRLEAARVGTLAVSLSPPYAAPQMPSDFVSESWSNGTLVSQTDSQGRDFHQILTGPFQFTKANDGSFGATTDKVPSFAGTGLTLSFWYRHTKCALEVCEVAVFYFEWGGLYLQENAAYIEFYYGGELYEGEYWYFEDNGVAGKFHLNGDKIWRHIALQLDEDNDMMRIFLDGELAVEGPSLDPVVDIDTLFAPPSLSMNYIEDFYGDISLADVRMYVHNAEGPLNGTHILGLAQGPTPLLTSAYKCLPRESPALSDSSEWTDAQGHDCEWYFNAQKEIQSVCEVPGAVENCPTSCSSKQECFARKSTQAYFVWERIRKISPMHSNGTICPSNDIGKSELVQECRRWRSSGALGSKGGRGVSSEHDRALWHWLDTVDQNGVAEGPHLNITECDELEKAVDEGCSFDMRTVRQFTEDLKSPTCDGFSIGFWVKALGESSLTPNGNFFPTLSILHSISPPEPYLSMGKMTDFTNVVLDLRSYSSDDEKTPVKEQSFLQEINPDSWTFIAYSNHFGHDEGGFTVQNNRRAGGINKGLGLASSLEESASFMAAIEVNTPMLISPIMMIPSIRTLSELQYEYLKNSAQMEVRDGPIVTNRERIQARVTVDKAEYLEQSTLMASPIVFQTMAQKSTICPYNYSSYFMTKLHGKAMVDKCDDSVYSCTQSMISQQDPIMMCTGALEENATFFGLTPTKFNDQVGYADFLSTIADNSFVYRNGIKPTRNFVNSATQQVQVVLVFFTPKAGLITVLNIMVDFSGYETASTSISVQHYGILEGGALAMYLIVQSIVLFNIALMLWDVFVNLHYHLYVIKSRFGEKLKDILQPTVDLMCASMVLVYIILMFQNKMASADEAASILNGLDDIPWSSPLIALDVKTESFFTTIEALRVLTGREEFINMLCNIILVINLLRVIQCTSLHPRLALLTGTLQHAWDDLWHTALLTCLLMLCFAGIGTWRFGNTLEAFGSFERTLQTEFEMLFGGFPEAWSNDPQLPRELQAFVVLYLMVLFLLVLNFLLAIIVEAYMKVRQQQDELATEGMFQDDIYSSVAGGIIGFIKGWPDRKKLGEEMQLWTAKISVGYKELLQSGHFRRGPESVISFLVYYDSLSTTSGGFLEPPRLTKWGRPPGESNEFTARGLDEGGACIVNWLNRKLQRANGYRLKPLREVLEDSLQIVAQRRRTRASEIEMEDPGHEDRHHRERVDTFSRQADEIERLLARERHPPPVSPGYDCLRGPLTEKDKAAVLQREEDVIQSGDTNDYVMRQISKQAQDIRTVKLATDRILQMLHGMSGQWERSNGAAFGSGKREGVADQASSSRPTSPTVRQGLDEFMPQNAVESKLFGGEVVPEPPIRRNTPNGPNGPVANSHISAMISQVPWTSFLPGVSQQIHDDPASGFAHRLVSNSPALQSPFIAAAMGNKALPPGPPGSDRV